MTLVIYVLAVTTLVLLSLVCWLTFRDPLLDDRSGSKLMVSLSWGLVGLPAFAFGVAMWGAATILVLLAGAYLSIVIATLGRPVLLMDQLFSSAWLKKPEQRKLRRRIALSQWIAIAMIGGLAVAVVALG